MKTAVEQFQSGSLFCGYKGKDETEHVKIHHQQMRDGEYHMKVVCLYTGLDNSFPGAYRIEKGTGYYPPEETGEFRLYRVENIQMGLNKMVVHLEAK